MPEDDAEPLLALDDDLKAVASNDEWAYRKADQLVKRLPPREGKDRRTEAEVFDRSTLMVLHKLLTHGVIRSLDFPVATGKEANVFRATTPGGGYLAVKIFRVHTATFKHVLQYIQGDARFQGVSGDKRALVHAWCQKEYRNLIRLREAGCSVPEPVKSVQNVLVMEYLGKKEGPWPTLKQVGTKGEPQRFWDSLVDDYAKAYNGAQLIHADLSEYNLMVEGADRPVEEQRLRMIAVGQAVLRDHPMAEEFLQRDVANVVRYFRSQGLDVEGRMILDRLEAPREAEEE